MDVHLSLGYLQFSVRQPQRWQRLLGESLRLPGGASPGSYRLDEACQRLLLREGLDDDIVTLGLDCGSEFGLARLLQRLRAYGLAVREAEPALRRERRVEQLCWLMDPAGTRVELFCGLAPADTPFTSPLFTGGFATGALGMGHVALLAQDLPAMERFYVEALGFGLTERLSCKNGPLRVQGRFLHCNRRHHSLALLQLPLRKRLHHFMLQTRRLADVGTAFERLQRDGSSMSLGLGQHPDPDGTFSFYAATPSGFDIEIGHGAAEIEPATWQAQDSTVSSVWGHKPSARLQLKMAGALLGHWLRRAA